LNPNRKGSKIHKAASILDSEQYITTTYAGGFPVGYMDSGKAYLFNHVNIIIEYHPLDVRVSPLFPFSYLSPITSFRK